MALTTVITGLFIVAGGVYALLNPRLGGTRDAGVITSAEPGPAERGIAYVIGGILLTVELATVALGVAF